MCSAYQWYVQLRACSENLIATLTIFQGTVLYVELTPTNNLQHLKRVIGGLVGAIHLRVDLRLSKVMVILLYLLFYLHFLFRSLSLCFLSFSILCLSIKFTFYVSCQIKGFVGAGVVTNALKEAGFTIVTPEAV